MKTRARDFAQLALLGAVFLTVTAFLISFVRGFGAPAPSGEDEMRATPWTTPANVDTRAVGRVEVLNGTQRAGLARDVTRTLRDAGFDVVFFGNAERTDSSVVLHRAGSIEIARAAADALGIRKVTTREDSTLLVDATVLLGTDWLPVPGR